VDKNSRRQSAYAFWKIEERKKSGSRGPGIDSPAKGDLDLNQRFAGIPFVYFGGDRFKSVIVEKGKTP